MPMLARNAADTATTGDEASVNHRRDGWADALLNELAILDLDVSITVTRPADLGRCAACERDAAVGGAVFTFPAAAVVVARNPHAGSTFRVPVCPGHAEDVIAEHLDRGRLVVVEAPTLPEAAPPPPDPPASGRGPDPLSQEGTS